MEAGCCLNFIVSFMCREEFPRNTGVTHEIVSIIHPTDSSTGSVVIGNFLF